MTDVRTDEVSDPLAGTINELWNEWNAAFEMGVPGVGEFPDWLADRLRAGVLFGLPPEALGFEVDPQSDVGQLMDAAGDALMAGGLDDDVTEGLRRAINGLSCEQLYRRRVVRSDNQEASDG